MTLASRVLGFVRDQVMAIVFGAGALTDVFLVAFKIPNFLRRLFAEGAFAQAFVPVFTEYKETKSPEALRHLAAHVVGFAPGFIEDAERFDLATHMLRITFPYLFFVSLLAYAGSIQNTFGRFAVPSFTPVLLNICMIAAALWFSPMFEQPIVALAWGVFVAGAVQLALQLPFLQQLGLLPRPRWGWRHSGVRRILKLMAPAVLGSSVAQINLLLDTIIASFLTVALDGVPVGYSGGHPGHSHSATPVQRTREQCARAVPAHHRLGFAIGVSDRRSSSHRIGSAGSADDQHLV